MKTVFTLLSLLLASISYAQTFNYTFSTFTDDYTELEGATVYTEATWDDPEFVIPIGFDFWFEGQTYNQLFLGFGFGGSFIFQTSDVTGDVLFALSADIIDVGYNTGEMLSPISALTTGAPGERICKVEWKNCGFYNQSDEGIYPDRINFQLWLYEGSNDFEIRFGPNTVKDLSVYDDFLTCGIVQNLSFNSDALDGGHLLTGDPANPTVISSANLFELESANITGTPANGRVYKFGSLFIGVDESTVSSTSFVYPTISEGLFTVSASKNALIQIFNTNGQLVMEERIAGSKMMDCSFLEAGVYVVRSSEYNAPVKIVLK